MNFKEIESTKEFWSIWHRFAQKEGHFLEFREIPRIWNVQDIYIYIWLYKHVELMVHIYMLKNGIFQNPGTLNPKIASKQLDIHPHVQRCPKNR